MLQPGSKPSQTGGTAVGHRQERHARESAQELGTGVLAVEAHREDSREDKEADTCEPLDEQCCHDYQVNS